MTTTVTISDKFHCYYYVVRNPELKGHCMSEVLAHIITCAANDSDIEYEAENLISTTQFRRNLLLLNEERCFRYAKCSDWKIS